MLRTTDFKREGLWENDVKLLLIDACLQCECDKIAIVYACEDVDKCISQMSRGDVALWVLVNNSSYIFFERVLTEKVMGQLQDIQGMSPIKKMYRIERMFVGFDVVELEFNN